jgi:hypothetical protein
MTNLCDLFVKNSDSITHVIDTVFFQKKHSMCSSICNLYLYDICTDMRKIYLFVQIAIYKCTDAKTLPEA